MPINVLMPALSPTMTEGKLASWMKKEGDVVASGDVLAEIETDKATMEIEAVDEGVLGKILVAEGTEGVAVNTPIAVIVDPVDRVLVEESIAVVVYLWIDRVFVDESIAIVVYQFDRVFVYFPIAVVVGQEFHGPAAAQGNAPRYGL